MNARLFFVLSNRIVINLAVCCSVIMAVTVGSVLSQETKTVRKNTADSSLVIGGYEEIPEATEQCAPAECEWWKQLREAGNDLQRKGIEKSKRKFVVLFVEGLEKSYRIPLKDRPPQWLFVVFPTPPSPGVRMKNGKVKLLVEYRSDGSVGEVKVISARDKTC